MNIYEMYVANGDACGFWVQRDSWGNCKALIVSVGGKFSGELQGVAPYFNNQEVEAEVYSFDGRRVPEDYRNGRLSCAGTYSYRLVSGPDQVKKKRTWR